MVVTNSSMPVLEAPFSRKVGQAKVVHSVRLFFLGLVLFITMVFQVLETRIVSPEVFFPVYVLVGVSFLLQILFFSFFQRLQKYPLVSGGMFVFEALYISLLIYFVGIQQSLLIFLFLVNIILCGILFQRKGALALATLTSVLFSFLLSLDFNVQGQTAFLAVGVNNLAFFSVAYLSGYLSEQLNFMGVQLVEKVRDIKALKNLNTLILDTMNSGLMTMETSGTIVQVNPFARRRLGKSADEIMGHSLSEFFPSFTSDELAGRVGGSFDQKLGPSGEQRDLRMHLAQLKDIETEASGYVLTFQDETEFRRLEGKLRQSEKLAAIGQLAAGIAHEIRNPLASISGSIQLLQDNGDTGSENRQLMNIVNREINRLNTLITEFLDYARPEAPMEDRVDLGRLLKDIMALMDYQQEGSGVQKKVQIEDGCKILGNQDKLKQAFLNIIVNGYQALAKEPEGLLSIAVSSKADFFEVEIKDNGCGIEDKVVKRIFEPFLTTKAKGTGLGLAITHSILESHNADVRVESQVGEGTSFKIRFPKSTL